MFEQFGCLDASELGFSIRAGYDDEAIERPIRHRSVGDGCLPGRTYDEVETEYHDEMDAIQQSPNDAAFDAEVEASIHDSDNYEEV